MSSVYATHRQSFSKDSNHWSATFAYEIPRAAVAKRIRTFLSASRLGANDKRPKVRTSIAKASGRSNKKIVLATKTCRDEAFYNVLS